MDAETPRLDRASAAFAISAAVAILFNTVIACAKDASASLKAFMGFWSGSDWLNQGIADVVIFAMLGLILPKTDVPEKIGAKALISSLVAISVISGVGLFVWYVLY